MSAWSGDCVVDGTPRLLPYRITKQKMTPTLCIADCSAQGYTLAGVQYGKECYCGNTDPPISKLAPEDDCNKACEGDGNLRCGGTWRMSVFSTGKGWLYKLIFIIYCTVTVLVGAIHPTGPFFKILIIMFMNDCIYTTNSPEKCKALCFVLLGPYCLMVNVSSKVRLERKVFYQGG